MLKYIKALRFLRVISFVMSAIFFALSLAAKGGAITNFFILFFVLLIAGSLMSKAINKLNEKEKIRLLFAQREKFYRILENPEQGFTPPTALLKSGETCFLIDYVNMGEVVTESVRTYTGTRLKLGSTPVYLGGGKSVANEKQKNVAYGELVLTNFRLIFVGNMRSIDLPLDKINSVECFQSSIRISQSGKNKPIFFNTVFNPQLWKEAILVLSDKK
ncbi:TPA: hypothetical protein ACLA7S_000207 [Neisseria meningitidis]|nr:hypothetical protein [Neisseria meningitidis]CBY91550.1 putative phage associated protein [Neisseria meningitidis WUE 2594]CWM69979.1 putative phage associated protein [Neisseria meningitidis]CWN43542.1 putative phage associated protein [Neisseria meningitidis]CWO16032.1 putative phage associated protein [Neisseria meningitidis]CWP38411.1 putative phage associated protein [Neisseria meningitidis]